MSSINSSLNVGGSSSFASLTEPELREEVLTYLGPRTLARFSVVSSNDVDRAIQGRVQKVFNKTPELREYFTRPNKVTPLDLHKAFKFLGQFVTREQLVQIKSMAPPKDWGEFLVLLEKQATENQNEATKVLWGKIGPLLNEGVRGLNLPLDYSPAQIRAWMKRAENQIYLKRFISLDLSSSNLYVIPNEVQYLTNLKSLYLYRNNIEEISHAFGSLTQLESLILNNNKIRYISPLIGNMARLKCLDLSNNNLEMIPLAIRRLTQLSSLDLSNNKIEKVFDELKRLSALEEIDLRGNRMRVIPPEILSI